LVALPGRNQHGVADLFGLTRYALLIARRIGGAFSLDRANFIQSQFGLTAAEMRVVLALVAGNDVATISDKLDISSETVRTHVKSTFAKTGTNRQSEIVSLMLQLL
jgi:DNA-binding CsgD family transcriptional regulator